MSIQTRNVTVTISEPNGTLLENARVSIKLRGMGNSPEGAVSPGEQIALTDENGQCVFELWENNQEYSNTYYEVSSYHPTKGNIIHQRIPFRVYDNDATLEELIVEAILNIDPTQAMVDQINADRVAAAASASSAASANSQAQTAASQANSSAEQAGGNATIAGNAAITANTAATTAQTYASQANTKSTQAANSATAAASSAAAAQASADAAQATLDTKFTSSNTVWSGSSATVDISSFGPGLFLVKTGGICLLIFYGVNLSSDATYQATATYALRAHISAGVVTSEKVTYSPSSVVSENITQIDKIA